MRSQSLNISEPLLKKLEEHGIRIATPIQKKIIPAIKEGKDVLAQSETGSGKTLSFAIPIIEILNVRKDLFALILVPTRELCNQIHKEFVKFAAKKYNAVTAVYGGVSISEQIRKIKHTNIIVATPGRLVDLINRRAVELHKIKYLVLDEADRMLDMGFITDIEFILKAMPVKPQTLLFSATVSEEIKKLSNKFLIHPVRVRLDSEVKPEFLNQTYYQTSSDKKLQLLVHLLKSERDLTLVFCNTKRTTDKLSKKLKELGLHAKALHGNLTQVQRERVTADFRNKRFNILIATDVAARGLHIEDISHVYNFDIPKDVDSYTHRVGRTARAGNKGEAISLVSGNEDMKFFRNILFNYNGVIKLNKADFVFTARKEDVFEADRVRRHSFSSRKPAPGKRTYEHRDKTGTENKGYPKRKTFSKKRTEGDTDKLSSPVKSMDYYDQKKKSQPGKFKRKDRESKAWRNY